MEKGVQLLIKSSNPYLKGYTLAVRNNWNHQIERVYISEREKELFLAKFGEKVVYENEFLNWIDSLYGTEKVQDLSKGASVESDIQRQIEQSERKKLGNSETLPDLM